MRRLCDATLCVASAKRRTESLRKKRLQRRLFESLRSKRLLESPVEVHFAEATQVASRSDLVATPRVQTHPFSDVDFERVL